MLCAIRTKQRKNDRQTDVALRENNTTLNSNLHSLCDDVSLRVKQLLLIGWMRVKPRTSLPSSRLDSAAPRDVPLRSFLTVRDHGKGKICTYWPGQSCNAKVRDLYLPSLKGKGIYNTTSGGLTFRAREKSLRCCSFKHFYAGRDYDAPWVVLDFFLQILLVEECHKSQVPYLQHFALELLGIFATSVQREVASVRGNGV